MVGMLTPYLILHTEIKARINNDFPELDKIHVVLAVLGSQVHVIRILEYDT